MSEGLGDTATATSIRLPGFVGRRPTKADLDDLARLLADDATTATLGGPRVRSEVEVILERWCALWEDRSFGPWILVQESDARFAGYLGLGLASAGEKGEVELLYALLPEYWGRGLATAAARVAIHYAFSRTKLTELIGYTLETNLASRRILERSGFRFEKTIVHAGAPHAFYRLHK